ncbi:hypothetical protein TrVGV298_003976 [Trichoderma virens]|nr:hypothetical protein TrVGV298_003976 [Trichoderma virens]
MASSSNPFRKSATQHPENRFPPIDSIDAAQLFPPPKTSFRDENVPPAAQSAAIDASKAKVVKKVRVLSPPPRSPDSPEWTASYFGSAAQTYAQEQDPFNNVDNDWDDATATPPPQPALPQGRQPLTTADMQRPVQTVANPFSKKKTQDAENHTELKEDVRKEGEVLKAAQSARRSLNVDSFKRLLMTGATSPPSSPLPTDSFDNNQADPPKPAQEASAATPINKEKKAPPPPPSSRHGKVIKPGQSVTSTESTVTSPREKPAEPAVSQNEPLPRPVLSRESSASSSSSVEDVPVEMDTHPPALTASPDQIDTSISPPNNAKKPVPAPPPRRQPRVEVKTNALDSKENEPPPRTSMESIPSRANSVRHSVNAPAPPPPRRTTSGSRQPSTPQSSTFIHPPDFDTPRTSMDSATRPMAPPPPPTRNPSTRRPQSLYGLESTHRRALAEIKPRDVVAPPPPPSRIRGSSQSSADGPSGRASLDSARKPRSSADEFGNLDAQYGGQSVDILADLESLQREVDALRGRMS